MQLKRFADLLVRDLQHLAATRVKELEFRWLEMCQLLFDEGPKSVRELAQALGVSHAAISQFANQLTARGIAATYKDPADRRKRVLALSKTGKELFERTRHFQKCLDEVVEALLVEADPGFMRSLHKLEAAIQKRGLIERFNEISSSTDSDDIEILDFQPEFAPAFEELNRRWIESHFEIVEADLRLLQSPQQEVIFPGGAIVFARSKTTSEIIGTGGLVNCHDGSGEIIKMAVDESARDQGIGRLVAEALIQRARERGMECLYLETNSQLVAARSLYQRLGFVEIELSDDSDFARADVRMKMDIR
jgi:ribosomal protein S18 acetylase RimI-like enzyme